MSLSFPVPGYPHATIQVVWDKDFRKVDVFTVSPTSDRRALHTNKVGSYSEFGLKLHVSETCSDPPWLEERYPDPALRLAHLVLLSGGSGCHGQVRSEMPSLGTLPLWRNVLDALPGMFESCFVLES